MLPLIFIALLVSFEAENPIKAQNEVLQGPIIAAQFEETILFEDIGTGHVWEFPTPDRVSTELRNWTPDGCRVLLVTYSINPASYALLSITDLTTTELPQAGFPFWSLDGETLLIFDYSRGNNSTDVFLADAQGQNPQLIRAFDTWIGQVKWLSQDELLYLNGTDYEWYTWSLVTDEITPFSIEISQEIFNERFYNHESISPNHEMLAGFFDIAAYRAAGDTRFVELTDEQLATLEAERPQVSGFDLIFLNENTKRHVEVNGQFLQSLAWSPSGRQIAVTTDYKGTDFGIYLYNVEADTIRRLTDAHNDLWYERYIPTWSPDEQWLAFKTSTGYVIENLITIERIQLDEEINGSRLLWSPVMDYSTHVCA